MRQKYTSPQTIGYSTLSELPIASSDKLERGIGSGGNTAETKEDVLNTTFDDEANIWE